MRFRRQAHRYLHRYDAAPREGLQIGRWADE
jgi:hypothetical protein